MRMLREGFEVAEQRTGPDWRVPTPTVQMA